MRIHIKDLKVGETYYECEMGMNLPFTVLEKPKQNGHRWSVKVRGEYEDGELREDDRYGAYAPRIYTEPQYI